MGYRLTEKGRKEVEQYIREMEAKRKEILDARTDTADETEIPTVDEIVSDIEWEGVDRDGYYSDIWRVTDSYDADKALSLKIGEDFLPDEPYFEISDIDWDSDGETVNAPETIYLLISEFFREDEKVNAENYGMYMYDDEIANYLSDEYGWCVNSFVGEYRGPATAEPGLDGFESTKAVDAYLESKWRELEDVSFDENADGELVLSEKWHIFLKGTCREDIWHWFDKHHSKGVAYLLYGNGEET